MGSAIAGLGKGKPFFRRFSPPPTSIKNYAQASSIRSREALAGAESSLGTVMGSVFPATMPSNVARSFSGVIFAMLEQALERRASTVSYTHLTLPTTTLV